MREFIICAAIHFKDGKKYEHQPKNIETGIVVTGRRHHNCYFTVFMLSGEKWNAVDHVQGFLTSTDKFVTRKEAYEIAKREGQLFSGMLHDDKPILISEELY